MILILIFNIKIVIADDDLFVLGPWHIQSLNGLLNFESFLKQQTNVFAGGNSDDNSSIGVKGRALLKLNSYIWNPKFLRLSAEGEWAPNAYQDSYIISPDRSESTVAERLQLQTSFFEKTIIPISLFGMYNHSYTNRELTSDVELLANSYGANLTFANALFPLSLNYSKSRAEQTELATAMKYYNISELSSISLNRGIGLFNKNRVSLSYEDTKYKYFNNPELQSYITRGNVYSRIDIAGTDRTFFQINGEYYHREGYQFYERYNGNVRFSTDLPERFKLAASYQLNTSFLQGTRSLVHNPIIRLENYLYESLHTYGFFQIHDVSHTSYNENRNISALGLNYQKFIPTGKLFVNYEFRYENNNRTSNPVPLIINREEYELDNSVVTILRFPYVREESIQVKNFDGTVIYTEELDYIVIEKGDYTQINRVPGGLIPDGSKVYIDYMSDMQSSYSYDLLTNNIQVRLNILNNFLDLYGRFTGNNYFNVDTSAFTVLHTLNRSVLGLQFNIMNVSIGGETDNYNTNNLPYISYRFFSRYSDFIMNTFSLSFDGDFIYYHFKNENTIQRIVNAAVTVDYPLNYWSSIKLSFYLRNQDDPASLLRILNSRAGYTVNIFRANLTAGLEIFYREVNGYINNYRGLFLRLERSF